MAEETDETLVEKRPVLRVDTVRDFAALLGVLLIAIGAWQVYRPAGLIVLGLLILMPAVVEAFR